MSNIKHNPPQFNQGSSAIFTYAPLNSSNDPLDQPQTHPHQIYNYLELHEDQLEPMPPRPLPQPSSSNVEAAVVAGYHECQKNHAASMGAYIVDGCGEFMADGEEGTPESLICAACDCHRSFHRREIMESESQSTTRTPPLAGVTKHPLKKRVRTKFTEEQKQKMHDFAEKLGWKIQKQQDKQVILQFCNEVGINKKVFKVWMHNSKQASKKKQDQKDPIKLN